MFNEYGKQYIYKGLFATLCAGLFIWLLTSYMADTASAFSSENWPSVEAKVIESNSIKGCGKGSSYYPKVKYEYVVGSNIYTSERIYFGSSGCGSQARSIEITNKYKTGQIVTARYNIMSPNESVLIAGTVLWDTWFWLILIVLGLIFFIVTLIHWFKKAKNNWLSNEIL